MKKLDAKEIDKNIGVEQNKADLNEFIKGVNSAFEHGTKFPDTNVKNKKGE